MVRWRAKEELEKLLSTIDESNEENEDLIEALNFAIADMNTLQNIMVTVSGVCEE